jgi:hypothetical protein
VGDGFEVGVVGYPHHGEGFDCGDDTVAAAVEPLIMMGVTDNLDLEPIAHEARDRLTEALHAL